MLLIENRERVVSKDEIIERIWDGRVVSESAVASRVKSARQAIGDSGEAQRLIRTAHKLGFRFVAEVESTQAPRDSIAARADAPLVAPVDEPARRPSIAVLPFTLVGVAGPYGSIADALPHDLIVELSPPALAVRHRARVIVPVPWLGRRDRSRPRRAECPLLPVRRRRDRHSIA